MGDRCAFTVLLALRWRPHGPKMSSQNICGRDGSALYLKCSLEDSFCLIVCVVRSGLAMHWYTYICPLVFGHHSVALYSIHGANLRVERSNFNIIWRIFIGHQKLKTKLSTKRRLGQFNTGIKCDLNRMRLYNIMSDERIKYSIPTPTTFHLFGHYSKFVLFF